MQECVCSIDPPNNSPDGDVATETGMRKHQDLSANLHGTTSGELKDRIAHRIVKRVMYQSFATSRQIVHVKACMKCMRTPSAELHLNLMLQEGLQQDAHMQRGLLQNPMIIEHVEPNVDNGRSIIIARTNVAIMCGAKLCHICIGHECVYQCRGISRGHQGS